MYVMSLSLCKKMMYVHLRKIKGEKQHILLGVTVKSYCFLGRRRNKMKQVHYKNQAVKLTAGCIHGGNCCPFYSHSLKKIISTVFINYCSLLTVSLNSLTIHT